MLTDKEISLILKMASRYELSPKTAYRIGEEYLLYDTNNSIYKINKVYSKRGDVYNQFNLANVLNEKNIMNTLRVIKSKHGEYFYKRHKSYYYITLYNKGLQFEFKNKNHVKLLTTSISDFHTSSTNVDFSSLNIKDRVNNLSKNIMENLYSFDRIASIINNRNVVSRFDEMYLKCLPYYTNLALIALSQIKDISINSLIDNNEINKVICINRFRSEELQIINNQVYFNNLSKCSINLRIKDLYELLMKAYHYSQPDQHLEFTIDIINEYNKSHILSKDEVKLLFAMIIFPFKFYRLGKRRYFTKKDWSESKYLHNLKKVTTYSQRSKKFINGFIEFLNDYEY
ncbi:hypothetical protein [Oceanirhabdus sp. W0125-5]|uniref:hypothetical protein n=1 Tax=Oceanirhabdus sp. W0125-5 TaxID=2999116 RepID=UPI0022F2C83D|nr:hypothetical protein [Oceanirhabdus sp. W0125-5]WBW95102.1 hypothetical protein OW730_15565 [Oceanirhabdus sp. W0125-5]